MSIERPEIPDVARGGDAMSPTTVTPNLLRSWPLPEPTGTKYSRGQRLVIGGDRSTPGAAMLSGQAALRVGLAQALVWGKHVHAAAGDVLAAEHGRVGFLAGEIPPRLPMALATLRGD
ncbi:hypothetical protein [Dermacoccus nishinomiyaensis]|uniref:hypothetical protein n=2 Tax=Dermacoccus nishinomiyaensis TaxID=1274 RepID=UPI0035E45E60